MPAAAPAPAMKRRRPRVTVFAMGSPPRTNFLCVFATISDRDSPAIAARRRRASVGADDVEKRLALLARHRLERAPQRGRDPGGLVDALAIAAARFDELLEGRARRERGEELALATRRRARAIHVERGIPDGAIEAVVEDDGEDRQVVRRRHPMTRGGIGEDIS